MLHYAVVFFLIALVAAVFGFGGIASSAVGIAQILFLVFVVLAAEALDDSAAQSADQAIRSAQRSTGEKLSQLASSVEEVRAQAAPPISRP